MENSVRRAKMIRVMIERRAKVGVDLSALLVELRVAAITHFRGYIGGETLINMKDRSNVVLSTWRSIEDWEQWANSETRTRLYEQIEPLLKEKPEVKVFEVMATEPTVRE